jgi:hypothetical protein
MTVAGVCYYLSCNIVVCLLSYLRSLRGQRCGPQRRPHHPLDGRSVGQSFSPCSRWLVQWHITVHLPWHHVATGVTTSTAPRRVTPPPAGDPVVVVHPTITTTTIHHPRRRKPVLRATTTTTTTTTTVASATTTAPVGIGLPATAYTTISCPTSENLTVTGSGNGTTQLAVTGAGGSSSSTSSSGSPVTITLSGPAGTYYFTATSSNGSPVITWSAAGAQTCSSS